MASLTGNPLKELWGYAKAWHSSIKAASFYSIANKIFDIFPEILIGVAIDIVVERDQSFVAQLGFVTPASQLTVLAALTFLIWALESATEYKAEILWRKLAQEIQHALRMDGVRHSQKLSLSWYEGKNTGQLLSTLGEDVNQVERFLNTGPNQIIQLLVSSLLVGGVFLYISPIISFFAILPIPIILLFGFKFRDKLSVRYTAVRESAGRLSAKLSGIMNGVVTIRAAVAEKHQIERVERESASYNTTNHHAIVLSSAFVPLIRMGVLAGFLFTLVLGGLKTFDGEIAPAAYTVLVFLTQRLLWPFTRFGEIIDLYERSTASIKRVLNLLGAPIDIKDVENPQVIANPKGQVELKGVTFQYTDRQPTIKDFSLNIAPGEFVAFVGPTGAGKSTLIKLMLRFYDITKGEMFVDGIPIQELALANLRGMIGYVSQDDFLFDGTIEENLKLPSPDIADHAMIDAAKAAEAHDFISQLPDGYQTKVGERGQKLSGGQRQRLAIARAIITKPKILIFDEATSAVDNDTEAAIQRSIERLTQTANSPELKTTLICIAHRLSTIKNADQIYVLRDGAIEERGKHQDLVANQGFYAKLWSIQTGS